MKRIQLFVGCVLALALYASAQEYVRIDRITIEKYRPSASEVRTIKATDPSAAALTDDQIVSGHMMYVAKIYANVPQSSALTPRLLIGGKNINRYGNFKWGIFVKFYTEKQVGAFAGKTVAIQVPTPSPIPSETPVNMLFPELTGQSDLAASAQSTLSPLKDVLAY
jgi:hypothetical protein